MWKENGEDHQNNVYLVKNNFYLIKILFKKEDKKEINKIDLVTSIIIKAWDLKEEHELDLIIKTI